MYPAKTLTILLFFLLAVGTVYADNWYKGALHLHSLWSDGDVAPELVASWYIEHGWNFVCFTDHNVLLEGDSFKAIKEDGEPSPEHVAALQEKFGESWVEQGEHLGRQRMRLKTFAELSAHFNEKGKFLLMQGEEISSLGGNPHVGGINVVERTGGAGGNDKTELTRQYMQAVLDQREKYGKPMISILNHPNFSDAITIEEALSVDIIRFFEVFNGHPSVHNWGHEGKGYPSTDKYWDVVMSMKLLKEPGYILYGVATDDAHDYHVMGKGANPGRGWVMVNAPELTADALVSAMEQGNFYASTGVLLDNIQRSDSGLSFSIKAEPDVTYTTQFFGTHKGFNTDSKPVLDENGAPKERASHQYSDDIGVLLAETTETEPAYTFKGDELYVRARVTSDKKHPNPFKEGDFEMAWVQPAIAR